MVRKSILSLIRKAVRFFLCAAEPLLSNSHYVCRDEPDSPSSTRAIYGSLPSPNHRQSFYLHRKSPILPAECTTPTRQSPTKDHKPALNIKESPKSTLSAKDPRSLGKTGPYTYLRRPASILRDLESRSNRRTHRDLMDRPEVGDGYIRKIAASDIATLEAAKSYLLAMSDDINTRFRQLMHSSTRNREATHQPTTPADAPAHHHPEPAPESQQRIIRPTPPLQFESPPFFHDESQAIAAAQPPVWHILMRNVLQGVMAARMARLAPGRYRHWAVELLRWVFRHL